VEQILLRPSFTDRNRHYSWSAPGGVDGIAGLGQGIAYWSPGTSVSGK